MSSIFNLLGGGAESDGGQIKPMARSKTSHEIRLNSLKMGGTKPKGLSIRSNSDMNVSNTHSAKNITHGKEQDCLKLKPTQMDNKGCPISPGRPAKKVIASKASKLKGSVLKEDTTNKPIKEQLNSSIFKKPLPPKKNIKMIPKPEKLTCWPDVQYNFDYGYIEAVEKEFKDLLSKEKENIKPCEENVSDSENLIFLDVPKLSIDRFPSQELLPLNLSDVSDISDDENLQ